jgi:hypothetical protein
MKGVIFWATLVGCMMMSGTTWGQSATLTPGAPQVQPGGGVPGGGALYSFPGSGTYTLPNGFTLIEVQYQVKIMRGGAVDPVATSPWTPVTFDTSAKTHAGSVKLNFNPSTDRSYMKVRLVYKETANGGKQYWTGKDQQQKEE